MNESARERILLSMNTALKQKSHPYQESFDLPLKQWSHEEKIETLKSKLEAVRSEVYIARKDDWTSVLLDVAKNKQIKSLLYSPNTAPVNAVGNLFQEGNESSTSLVEYEGSIESFKDKLFETDAAITSTCGAIAENGALILWPDKNEPRLMSLVPPIHIAVIDAANISGTFSEAMESGKWTEGMPSNVVLISGPSKTADIELLLAFGVHGPKELVVIIIN